MFTFEGDYRRRTFWEWLTLKPRQLQRYTFSAEIHGLTRSYDHDFSTEPPILDNKAHIGKPIKIQLPEKHT